MPLYDYFCSHCEKKFEAFVPMDKRDIAKCPVCDMVCIRDKVSSMKGANFEHFWFVPGMDPGLRRYIKSKKHRKQVCKEMNVVPIG